MDLNRVADKLFYYTSGYPFLVSRMCILIDRKILPAREVLSWIPDDVDTAFRLFVKETNTNFDSLIKNIENNDELYDFVRNIIIDSDNISFIITDPLISLGLTFGIFREQNGRCVVHNRIYEHILSNHLMSRIAREKKVKKMALPANEF